MFDRDDGHRGDGHLAFSHGFILSVCQSVIINTSMFVIARYPQWSYQKTRVLDTGVCCNCSAELSQFYLSPEEKQGLAKELEEMIQSRISRIVNFLFEFFQNFFNFSQIFQFFTFFYKYLQMDNHLTNRLKGRESNELPRVQGIPREAPRH